MGRLGWLCLGCCGGRMVFDDPGLKVVMVPLEVTQCCVAELWLYRGCDLPCGCNCAAWLYCDCAAWLC